MEFSTEEQIHVYILRRTESMNYSSGWILEIAASIKYSIGVIA